jgi:hypothetical protein
VVKLHDAVPLARLLCSHLLQIVRLVCVFFSMKLNVFFERLTNF